MSDDASSTRPLTGNPGQARSSPWQPPSVEELQSVMPLYEVVRLLGRGGMGAVYQGVQRSLDRMVAIKILPPGLDDAELDFSRRFKQEAKAMARLLHPGIVAVYDAGETTNGLLYFVMEYMDGTDVQQMLNTQGRLPQEHALAITAHVCDALAYAHDHGIVHRDIKPSNIIVSSTGEVKVADFGLAKMATENGEMTRSNVAVGTPDFVAPEALIAGMGVDGRADLYAVGVMLYQMLTGNIPRGVFVLPSKMIPEIDPRFDAIIAKAMQTDREMRFDSAYGLRGSLDAILTTPLAAIEPSAPAQEPKPVAKSRTPVTMALFVIVALIIGAGAWLALRPKANVSEETKEAADFDSSAPIRYTTGPWKRVLESEEAVKGSNSNKFELIDHWFTSDGLPFGIYPPMVPGVNHGIRAVFKYVPGTAADVSVRRYTTSEGISRSYSFRLDEQSNLRLVEFTNTGKSSRPQRKGLGQNDIPVTLKSGDEFMLELIAIGEQLTAKFNGQVVVTYEGASIAPGRASAYTEKMRVRVPDLLILDGIPSADAPALIKGTTRENQANAATPPTAAEQKSAQASPNK